MASTADANLASLLSTLESKTTKRDDKIEAYQTICNNLKEEELSLFAQDVTKEAKRVMCVLRNDIKTELDSVAQGALQVLGFCLHDPDIVRAVPAADVKATLTELCDCAKKTVDKLTCTRALWCLSRQSLPAHHVSSQVDAILLTVAHALDHWKGQSITVEFEAVNTIARLQDQVPKEMNELCLKWAKELFPLLVHTAVKVREKALGVLQKGATSLTAAVASDEQFRHAFISDLKTKWLGKLTKLFQSRNEIYMLTVWSMIVQIMGKFLHSGSFINQILPLIELGFKSSSAPVKCEAFEAWKCLIDNFALNPDIISDAKRVKLIMQVFKINNAKVESVAEKKVAVWWHFIQCLGPKVSSYFDQVCVPLLQMCVGSSKLGGHVVQSLATPTFSRVGAVTAGASPITPRLNLTNPGTQYPTFPSLQLTGCQVLALLLGEIPADVDIPNVQYSIGVLSTEVMTGPSFFLKQSATILSCAKELLISQGENIPEGLLYHVWYALVAHVKNVVESGAKSESRDVLTTFLNTFQLILLSEAVSYTKILKLFQAVCCLPTKALCSTAYQMGGGEVLHGTPVMFLTELLLTPKLLESCVLEETYMSLFGKLIEIGVSHGGVLEFSQLILQVLDRHAQFVGGDQLWRMWSTVVNPLQDHIKKTNEVNQGDVLEHDFTCMYTSLMFPVSHLLTVHLSTATMKTLLKTWSELYGTFARLSSMVTNTEANVSCEQLCHRIHSTVDFNTQQELNSLDALVQMLEAVVGQVDFSSLGAPRPFTATLSPSRWMKKKQRPLENVHSFVMVLAEVMTSLQHVATSANKTPGKQKNQAVMLSVWSCIVGVLTILFTHVTSSQIIGCFVDKLAHPLAELYQSGRSKGALAHPASFLQKLEKLWLDIATCLQARYTGGFDSDFLSQLSPLLEVTFVHSRRQIKTQTVLLWNATFSKSHSLIYPETLKPVLMKVKELTPLLLPGWISSEVPVVEETPVSQFSQAGSSAPEPRIPGLPSPHKIRGSFLNKAVSPNIKKSPARPPAPKFEGKSQSVGKAKKNLSLSDMRDEDFVVIVPSPKQKRVLTDHQKEVLRERRSLPAMYNNLELSQDVSLSAHFITDTQTERSSQSDSVIILDSQKSEPSPQCETDHVNSSEAKPEEQKGVKRRRSIRFSDEVFEEPMEAPTTARGSGEGVIAEETSKDLSLPGQSSATSDAETTAPSDVPMETSDDPIVTVSSTTEESDSSLKPNLLQAMGMFLSDMSTTSSAEKSASVPDSDKNVFASPEINTSKQASRVNNLSEKSPGQSSCPNSSKNSSLGQLFSFSDDSCSVSMVTPVNMDSVVEDTQDMLSPNRTDPLSPQERDSVMETPVKSVDDSLVMTTTPTSRALFHKEPNEGHNATVAGPCIELKSPVIKIHRLSGNEIHKFSPHRLRRSENDDLVQSQSALSDCGKIAAARVRRSLSNPQSGRFGGELLGDPKRITCELSATDDKITEKVSDRVTSPDKELSQGFTPVSNSQEDCRQIVEESVLEATDVNKEKQKISVCDGKAELQMDIGSPEIITSTQVESSTAPYVPDLAAPTLKNSTELFSELSPIVSTPSSECEANSEHTPEGSMEQTDSCTTKTEGDDSAASYHPELTSTLAASSDVRSRRKSHVPTRSTEEIARNTRARRKSMPAVSNAKSKANASSGMRTRTSGKDDKVENTDAVNTKKTGTKKSTQDSVVEKIVADGKQITRRTRRSCLEAIENTETSSQDSVDLSIVEGARPTRRSGKVVKDSQNKEVVEESRSAGSERRRGIKRGRRGEKFDKSPVIETLKKETCVTMSDEEDISFKCNSRGDLKPGVTEEKDRISEDCLETALPKDLSPDKTPDSREIVQKEPQRQSTSLVKRELSKGSGGTSRPNTPKARKSLTTVNPFGSDSDENIPLSAYASQNSSDKKQADVVEFQDLDESKTVGDALECKEIAVSFVKDIAVSSVKDIAASSVKDIAVSSVKDIAASSVKDSAESSVKDIAESSVKDIAESSVVQQENMEVDISKDGSKPTEVASEKDYVVSKLPSEDCVKSVNILEQEEGSAPDTPTRQGPPRYKVAKTSPINLRTRSAQKVKKAKSQNECESPKSATKGKRLSLTRKKLNVGKEKIFSEEKAGKTKEGDEKTIMEITEKVDIVKSAAVDEDKMVEPSTKATKGVSADSTTTVSNANKNQAETPNLTKGKFTGIKQTTRVRFTDEEISSDPRNSDDDTILTYSPLKEATAGTTSPRGILKHTSASKAFGGFSKMRHSCSPWSRALHSKKVHPVTVPRLYSPSASPSASILKRRRLSGDLAKDSPSPPSKQRRVSFAEPVSDAGLTPSSPCRTTQVNRCLDLPTPSSPLTSRKRDQLQGLSQGSGSLSTQESQLNCTEPVYPQLQQCTKPVENVLPQLTSSIWSRGLEQLVRARNIRTVGDLCNLSEYEVHNLPIRSPKVTTLRRVLKQFEGRTDRRAPSSSSSGGISSLVDTEEKNSAKEMIVDTYTPPGSPQKSDTGSAEVSTGGQTGPLNKAIAEINQKSDAGATVGETGVPQGADGRVTDEAVKGVPQGGEEALKGSELGEDDGVLPAVEDALSELSPSKGNLAMNTSIDCTDDESELPKLGADMGELDERDSPVKDTQGHAADSSGNVAETVLKDIDMWNEKLMAVEIDQLSSGEVVQLHSHLTRLMNTTSSVLPKLMSRFITKDL